MEERGKTGEKFRIGKEEKGRKMHTQRKLRKRERK